MTTLDGAAARYADARQYTREARTALRAAVRAAVRDGMPETEAARRAGVTRQTIRAWLGK